jgi:hypothetical protein
LFCAGRPTRTVRKSINGREAAAILARVAAHVGLPVWPSARAPAARLDADGVLVRDYPYRERRNYDEALGRAPARRAERAASCWLCAQQ